MIVSLKPTGSNDNLSYRLPQLIKLASLSSPAVYNPQRQEQVHHPHFECSKTSPNISRLEPRAPQQRCDCAPSDTHAVVTRLLGYGSVHHGLDMLSNGVIRRIGWQCCLPSADLIVIEFGLDSTCDKSYDLRSR
jgi:hypothetical protein